MALKLDAMLSWKSAVGLLASAMSMLSKLSADLADWELPALERLLVGRGVSVASCRLWTCTAISASSSLSICIAVNQSGGNRIEPSGIESTANSKLQQFRYSDAHARLTQARKRASFIKIEIRSHRIEHLSIESITTGVTSCSSDAGQDTGAKRALGRHT